MSNVYAISKYIPGQIWFAEINTENLDGNWTKKRPYFVVAANNRRLVLLRMTHGGEKGTNWLYRIDMGGEKPMNIICDAPITVATEKFYDAQYKYMVSPDMTMDICQFYLAAMIHQSVPTILDGDGAGDIQDIVKNHEDRNLAFSKYLMTFSDDDEDAVDSGVSSDDIDETEETEEETEVTEESAKIMEVIFTPVTPEPQTQTQTQTTVIHTLGTIKPGEKVGKVKSKAKKNYPATIRHLEVERDYILATDCFIFNKGWTKSDVISIALSKIGLKNTKFVMDDLKNRNKVVYMNNQYNVTLKSSLIVNTSKTRTNAKDYAREIIADCETVGFARAGLIWNRAENFMRQNYWKFKEELASKSAESKGA